MRIVDGNRCDIPEKSVNFTGKVVETHSDESLIADPRCGVKPVEHVEEKLQRALQCKRPWECDKPATISS